MSFLLQQSLMAVNPDQAFQIPVDAEHNSLRFVVAIVFVILAVGGYVLLSTLIPANVVNLVAVLGGLFIAAAGTYLFEQQLKRRWSSGRVLDIGHDAIRLLNRGDVQISVNPSTSRTILWRFEITRRTRVPKGWFMVAAALESEDEVLAVYTLMPPETYKQIDPDGRFTKLQKVAPAGSSASDLRLAGEQKRLHRAEGYRWRDGAEVTNENFATYFAYLERFSRH